MSIELSGKNINMKILLLTQWFDPEPTFKGLAFAKELTKQGHEVEVLTGFPNYPQGKLYDGYKLKLFQKENIEGISVLRVPLYASHDNSAFKRVLNYASFAVSATLYGIKIKKKADVIYACGPMPMLRAIKHYAQENGQDAYISLEERMACGVGACLGCVCNTVQKDAHSHVNNTRICTDGPVFAAKDVDI